MDNHRQEAGVEAPQEQEDIRAVQGGEGNGGDFAVPELRPPDGGSVTSERDRRREGVNT